MKIDGTLDMLKDLLAVQHTLNSNLKKILNNLSKDKWHNLKMIGPKYSLVKIKATSEFNTPFYIFRVGTKKRVNFILSNVPEPLLEKYFKQGILLVC